jgi:hypothetical protein
VNQPENEDVECEYHKFDAEDLDCQQEFLKDADGDEYNLFPFDAC